MLSSRAKERFFHPKKETASKAFRNRGELLSVKCNKGRKVKEVRCDATIR